MTTAIVIFAKLPIAGFAKTRLIPALGAAGAAQLARQLLKQTVTTAVAADLGPIILAVTPTVADPLWAELGLPTQIDWQEQIEGNLGARLAHAAQNVLTVQPRVLLIGTDCPELDARTLRDAAGHLASADVCMVPVTDGGYALLGMRRFDPQLFTDIPWSTAAVAAKTREKCSQLGWSLSELPTLHDIDEPADLRWLDQL